MISCLNQLIGVRGLAGYEDPDSGVYINDLQGITLTKLEDISDQEDHYEPRLAWVDIRNNAARLLESDVKKFMKPYFRNFSQEINGITSQLTEKVTLSQSNTYNGWLFDLGTLSEHKRLRLNKFALYLNTATTFSIYIFDASTGDQLDTIEYSGAKGLNEYRILKDYPIWKYRNIYIAYDASVVSTVQSETYHVSLGSVKVASVAKGTAPTIANLDGTETGMMLNFSLECSVDNFVCQRQDILTDAFLYKLGIEFTKEVLFSERINRFTLMDRDTAKELQEMFKESYDEIMEGIFRDIKVTQRDECFECAKAITYKMTLP